MRRGLRFSCRPAQDLYRGYAVVMLAEIQLRLGAAAAGLDLLQEALPLLLEHAPAALQAHALLVRAPPGAYAFSPTLFPHSVPCLVQVLGKARLALAGEAGTAATVAAARVAGAAEALEQSLSIFKRVEAYRRAKEVAYLLARAYHTLVGESSGQKPGVDEKTKIDEYRAAR